MGMFGLFSRKDKKKDEDALHLALQKAMENPESREAFYGRLLRSNLLVRTERSGGATRFMTFKDGTLPVFSCLQRLIDDPSIDGFPSYATVPATEVFASCPGAAVHLNPFSECNKLLGPDEIAYISRPPASANQKMELPEDAVLLLAPPREVPEAMLDFLRRHFRNFHAVAQACLSLMRIEGCEETPHYLVSVVTDREVDDFSRLLPENMTRFIQAGSYVDFRPVSPEEMGEKDSILLYER
jgi:hypothetical protein